MAFMALFGWMFIPLFLAAVVIWIFQSALLWMATHTVLVNIAAALLLAINLLAMVRLLRARNRRKRERKYRVLLLLTALWEGCAALLCGLYLIVQPLRYIPIEKLPVDVGKDYTYSRELLHGTWTVTACQGRTPDCTLTEEEIDRFIGRQITYSADRFVSPDGAYPLEPSYAYQHDIVGKDDFLSKHGVELEALGVCDRQKLDFVYLFLPEESFWDTPFGEEFYVWHRDTLLICRDGAFFRAERNRDVSS